MKGNFKLNRWYMIRFLDHCEGHEKVHFTICAYVYDQDEEMIWATTWKPDYVFDEEEIDYEKDDNSKNVAIAKSTIKKKKIILKDLEVH